MIEFIALTSAGALAMIYPMTGLPCGLLIIALSRFYLNADVGRPATVKWFITFSCFGMVSLATGIPQKWLLSSTVTQTLNSVTMVGSPISLNTWKFSIFLVWTLLFHLLLRRYGFTQGSASAVSDQSRSPISEHT